MRDSRRDPNLVEEHRSRTRLLGDVPLHRLQRDELLEAPAFHPREVNHPHAASAELPEERVPSDARAFRHTTSIRGSRPVSTTSDFVQLDARVSRPMRECWYDVRVVDDAKTEELTRHLLQQPYEETRSDERRAFWIEREGANAPHVPVASSVSIGSHPSNDLVLDDRKASRFHCELLCDARGVRLRDLESSNGTFLQGIRIESAWLRDGDRFVVGETTLVFRTSEARLEVPRDEGFAGLVGRSAAMQELFATLRKAASTDITVLLEGETGTGKEVAAHAIHHASARAKKPFVVLDCSAIPENLIESELFGHERGAFTGAVQTHVGAFEEANGGTLFLDEMGELPSDLQPKLLRALEDRTIRRVGGKRRIAVDIRVIAATNRDLRREVNEGRFRADLYFRLAVLRVALPALRQRPEDFPELARHFLAQTGATPTQMATFTSREFVDRLAQQRWPGNVRELRNYLERCVVLDATAPMHSLHDDGVEETSEPVDLDLPFQEARAYALARFEKAYLRGQMKRHATVADAAKAADLHRVYFHRLLTRHRLRDE
jgi:transcriptional regulator with GAF, ATPase, and Fis domain